ncbi:putative sugar nucleotidyltransferase [Pseudomonas aeruginosa]|nr:putative sugar nucleotidyltransferase [Pseudomonas aeruginosa]
MSPIEHAVISAAGIGSRLGLNKPKCLVEVGGKTLLAQHLERLAEIPNVWVVVGSRRNWSSSRCATCAGTRSSCATPISTEPIPCRASTGFRVISTGASSPWMATPSSRIARSNAFSAPPPGRRPDRRLALHHQRWRARSAGCGWRAVTAFTASRSTPTNGRYRDSPAGHGGGPADIRVPGARTVLPLPAQELDAFDIDTASDLDMARRVHLNNWNLND